MSNFAKNILLAAMLSTSSFEIVASIDQSDPSNFTEKNVMALGGSEFNQYSNSFSEFLMQTEKGASFLKENFPDGLPPTKATFRDGNPVGKYRLWYTEKFGGKASKEELEKVKLEVKEEMSLTVNKLKKDLVDTQILLSGGGSIFTNRRVNEIIEQIRASYDDVQFSEMVFDDSSHEIGIVGSIGDREINERFSLPPHEYNRLKIILTMFNKMYSKSFNEASNGLGNLVTDILSSATPQDYHFKQITDLANTSSKLETYLSYHKKQETQLTAWKALPLKGFLDIRFLAPEDVEAARGKIEAQFKLLVAPLTGVNLFNSKALDDFVNKVYASIMLPTESIFSDNEIAAVFKDLGILLDIDDEGEVDTGTPYFNKLEELSKAIKELKKILMSKDKQTFETQKAKFVLVDKAIQELDLDTVLTSLSELVKEYSQEPPVVIGLKNVNLQIAALSKIANDSPPILSYQDAAADTTAAIKVGGAQIIPIRVALFLMQKFAPVQFARTVNRSIVGNVDPAIKAACAAYYGRPLDIIREALLDVTGFTFDKNAHAALKSSENVGFIKTYLDSVIAGKPIVADLNALKKDLGLDVSAAAKTKNALIIRTCELLDSDEIEAKLDVDVVKKITERAGHFNNPEISEVAMRFEVLASTLNSEDAKARFSDLYFRLDLKGIDKSARQIKLRGFFDSSLAANAKDNNLVKLVLKLPSEKQKHNKKIDEFRASAKQFEALKAQFEKLKEFALKEKYDNPDQELILTRAFEKLKKLQDINSQFLVANDDSSALVIGGGVDKSQKSFFRVTAGLPNLLFERLFESANNYGYVYSAVKVLHFFELTTPSDDDFDTLSALVLSKAKEEVKDLIEADIKALIAGTKGLKANATEFTRQITELLQFVEDFNVQKQKYNVPEGPKVLGFYAAIDALPGASDGFGLGLPPKGLPMMGGLPGIKLKPFGLNAKVYGEDTTILSEASFSLDEAKIHDKLFGKKFNKSSASSEELRLLTAEKIKNFYIPILQAQKKYFSAIDFSKINEEDSLPFVRQLLVFVDLYLRMSMTQLLHVVDWVKTPAESLSITTKFKEEYLNLLGEYSVRSIYNCYKNPGALNDASTAALTKMLRNVAPELRERIGNVIIGIFQSVDMSNPIVDVASRIMSVVDEYLKRCTFVMQKDNHNKTAKVDVLDEGSIKSFLKFSKK